MKREYLPIIFATVIVYVVIMVLYGIANIVILNEDFFTKRMLIYGACLFIYAVIMNIFCIRYINDLDRNSRK